MPISIAGSGTITGISAGGLPDGVITTDDIAANAVTTAKLGSAEQSGLCKAWVNFNGTGTVAIRASYNVSSITDNGVGDYTVNFTTAMADANYCVTGSCGGGSGRTDNLNETSIASKSYLTGNVNILSSYEYNPQNRDSTFVNVAIFR
jgi:hypothetical protein